MGRIRTTLVKRTSVELIERHRDSLNANFEDNKKKIPELAEIGSKKLRNVIAGYVTKLMKRELKEDKR